MSDPRPTKPRRTLSIERFEERLQALIEDNLERLLEGRLKPQTLARKLARVLEEGIRKEDGVLSAPDRFTVWLNPDDLADLTARYSDVADRLAEQLHTLASSLLLQMNQRPSVVLVSDASLAPNRVVITGERTEPHIEQTQQMAMLAPPNAGRPKRPRDASLVVDGRRYITLERSVINIGRRRDNHIVLDDKRVSRQHCQLRLRFGRYVIYDLRSKGGTAVNGHLVQEHILQPGDVISLAGFELVYVEDPSTSEFAAKPARDTQLMPTLKPDDADGGPDAHDGGPAR
jgi:hypothetical protein